MRALDLFCCGGGATRGLQLAGFQVTGVDIAKQPRYCGDAFHQADALTFPLEEFDFIWASPPCQAFTRARKLQGNVHPDLIEPIRNRLVASGVPYCIESVEGAPLINPMLLCGAMFGLGVYRHRLFETSFFMMEPGHPPHDAPITKMGRPPRDGEFMHVVGNFSGVAKAQRAMGIDWLGQGGLREAIPPAYSEFIGRAAIQHILHTEGLAA